MSAVSPSLAVTPAIAAAADRPGGPDRNGAGSGIPAGSSAFAKLMRPASKATPPAGTASAAANGPSSGDAPAATDATPAKAAVATDRAAKDAGADKGVHDKGQHDKPDPAADSDPQTLLALLQAAAPAGASVPSAGAAAASSGAVSGDTPDEGSATVTYVLAGSGKATATPAQRPRGDAAAVAPPVSDVSTAAGPAPPDGSGPAGTPAAPADPQPPTLAALVRGKADSDGTAGAPPTDATTAGAAAANTPGDAAFTAAWAALSPAGSPPPAAVASPGPALAPAAAMPLSPQAGDWPQQLGDRVQWLIGNGLQEARLRLHPQELGAIAVQVRVEDGRASVLFAADHPAARAALAAALPQLRTQFVDSGLTLAQAQVQTGVDSGAGFGSQTPAQSGRQGSGSAFGQTGSGWADADGEGTTTPIRVVRVGLLDEHA